MSEGVTVTMKDGTKREFPDGGSRGASYRVEGAMVVVTDKYGNESAYPVADIQELHRSSQRGW